MLVVGIGGNGSAAGMHTNHSLLVGFRQYVDRGWEGKMATQSKHQAPVPFQKVMLPTSHPRHVHRNRVVASAPATARLRHGGGVGRADLTSNACEWTGVAVVCRRPVQFK